MLRSHAGAADSSVIGRARCAIGGNGPRLAQCTAARGPQSRQNDSPQRLERGTCADDKKCLTPRFCGWGIAVARVVRSLRSQRTPTTRMRSWCGSWLGKIERCGRSCWAIAAAPQQVSIGISCNRSELSARGEKERAAAAGFRLGRTRHREWYAGRRVRCRRCGSVGGAQHVGDRGCDLQSARQLVAGEQIEQGIAVRLIVGQAWRITLGGRKHANTHRQLLIDARQA